MEGEAMGPQARPVHGKEPRPCWESSPTHALQAGCVQNIDQGDDYNYN